eukprot:gene27925-36787_t
MIDSGDQTKWTAFLLAFIWAAYISVFVLQSSRNVDSSIARLLVLSLRSAFCLPFYALFIWVSIAKPEALHALLIFITFMEGLSFYSFVNLIVTDCGGPFRFVQLLQNSGKSLVCGSCCCPKDFTVMYKRASWAAWNFWFTRTLLSIGSCICIYSGRPAAKALGGLFTLMGAIIMFYAVLSFLLQYELILDETKNIAGVLKFLVIKVSVGAIVVQGLVAQFLSVTATSPYVDDDHFTADEKTTRGYCTIVLLEFTILSLVMVYAFGVSKILPPESKEVVFEPVQASGCCSLFFQLTYKSPDLPASTITSIDVKNKQEEDDALVGSQIQPTVPENDQKSKLEASTARLQILSLRAAFCLPFYGLFIWICILNPKAYPIILIFVTFMEGLAFYNYVSMVVLNCGGPFRFVELLQKSSKTIACCGCCCSKDFVVYYQRTSWAIWHFWWTRTALEVLICICTESGSTAGKAIGDVFSAIGAIIALYAILSFLLMYEIVYNETKNIAGVAKFLMIKMSVGAIVILGLVVSFLIAAKKTPYVDDDAYDTSDKTYRGYCALVEILFVVFGFIMLYAFTSKITPPEKVQDIPPVQVSGCCGLIYEVFFKYFDSLGSLTYTVPAASTDEFKKEETV